MSQDENREEQRTSTDQWSRVGSAFSAPSLATPVEIDQPCRGEGCGKTFKTERRIYTMAGNEYDLTENYCPDCCARISATAESQQKAALQQAQASVRRKWREDWSGIPAKYQLTTFEAFERQLQPTMFKIMEDYANAWTGYPKGMASMFIYSEHPTYGVGKTHLMAAMGHRILDRWKGDPDHSIIPIRFMAERELFRSLRASYNPTDGRPVASEEQIYRRLTGAPLLILDDLGKEVVKDPSFVQRVYWNLVDARYQADLPMVISSNISLDGVSDRLGQATAERIMEMTQGNIVEVKGSSFRFREVA